MHIQHISSGAQAQRNDDHVAVFEHDDVTDILVLDGGSSVAGHDVVDRDLGDVAWFVHAFTGALETNSAPACSQQEAVRAAIACVRQDWDRRTAGLDVPAHAWPIAALTWLRVERRAGVAQAQLYSLGDCKTLLRLPGGGVSDPDPFVNPQEAVLQQEIARLRAAGIDDPAERRERMLPMLRGRRAFQNTAPAPAVLCLRPNGPFAARRHSVDLAPGASVLVMTDGFYRLVDPYGLYTDAGLVEVCLQRGVAALLDELRTHEAVAPGTAARAVKVADDAAAVLLQLG